MKTIAVIDDDIHIGNILEELLQREGYAVLRAYSGTEAVLLLERQRPDLVLLDLMLPGLSGEEVLAKIGNVPVIVVSAKVGVENRVNLLLRGAVDYLEKPFDSRELLARVAVHLRESAAPGPASVLEAGPLRLDPAAHAVTAAGVLDLVVGMLTASLPAGTLPFTYTVLLCPITTVWYLLAEVGSVIENAGSMGAPVPPWLKKAIAALRDRLEEDT